MWKKSILLLFSLYLFSSSAFHRDTKCTLQCVFSPRINGCSNYNANIIVLNMTYNGEGLYTNWSQGYCNLYKTSNPCLGQRMCMQMTVDTLQYDTVVSWLVIAPRKINKNEFNSLFCIAPDYNITVWSNAQIECSGYDNCVDMYESLRRSHFNSYIAIAPQGIFHPC
jgi:hypothetical protein